MDIRDLDGERLLASSQVGDNVIAILTRLQDRQHTVAEILSRISDQPPPLRETALKQLLKLAGLRRLEEFVEREARRLPLLDDILDNKVFAREYNRGVAEGELIALRRLIRKRFGNVPSWAEERLATKSSAELGDLIDRFLDVKKLEDLLE